MRDAPGSSEAGYLAFQIVDGLINALIAKGVLTRADVADMLASVAESVSHDGKMIAQQSAPILRKLVAEYQPK